MKSNKLKIVTILIFSALLFSCASTPASDADARFKKEKQTIYSMLKSHYAGFDMMVERGFTKQAWDQCSNYDDIRALFDTCINDMHLIITNYKEFTYHQNQAFDADSIRSNDPERTFIKKTTSNTYYLRYNSCNVYWDEYAALPSLAEEAATYDYIVLDFRSNGGGGNTQQRQFFNNLYNLNYKGTIYVTQDNWSYSSGEVWMMASRFTDKLSVKLIGTHSGGMQIYGNCVEYNKNGMYFYLPGTSFATILPDNYLGEGKGYQPDIWANKNNMKQKLEALGLDLRGITFN